MSRLDLEESIYSNILEEDIKGFVPSSCIDDLKCNTSTGKVLKGMEYRPDLVASYYLGNPKCSWAITLVNGFFNGIEDYRLGRKLIIPDIDNL